jgi:hypothetical protein
MKKPSQRPQTNDTGGESRALYFAPWFRSGMPIIIFLHYLPGICDGNNQHFISAEPPRDNPA